jgi:hypothetical protein
MSKKNEMEGSAGGSDPEKRWRVTCEDATDGSGDVIISLPNELCAALEWKVGDTLEIHLQTDDNSWVLTRR